MPESSVPVCSPTWLKGQPTLDAEQIASLPLLQQSTRPYAWRQWFESQGMSVARDLTGTRYELFSMLAQAAIHEMGVALIPAFLIEQELASGQLIIAHPQASHNDKAYYLMIPDRKAESAALCTFRDWLMSEARSYRQFLEENGAVL